MPSSDAIIQTLHVIALVTLHIWEKGEQQLCLVLTVGLVKVELHTTEDNHPIYSNSQELGLGEYFYRLI